MSDISNALIDIGFDEKNAAVIGFVLQNKQTTQKQLIDAFGLSQQSVANSLKFMISKGWIQAVQMQATGKHSGRPANSYQTLMTAERVMDSILDDKKASIAETVKRVAKLKKLFAKMEI